MRVNVLTGWLLAGLLAASPALSGETAAPLQTGFDQTALDMELSLSSAACGAKAPTLCGPT